MRAAFLHRMATCIAAGSLILGAGGCVSLVRNTARSHQIAPNGLAQSDDQFRRALVAGNFENAYERSGKVKSGAPQDKLLRALYRGTTAFHAGDFAVAAQSFGEADRISEERETRSVSRHAAALITNDQVLSYLPSRTERLFTRYYAMMSYLRADNRQAATVEARRLGAMLQQTSDSIGATERAVHAMLRDAAGAVFESAGEMNDALVSYRNAALLRGASPQALDSVAIAPVHPDSATIVVFVEAGFVAHRVNQEISVPFGTSSRERRSVLDSSATTSQTSTDTPLLLAGPLTPPIAESRTRSTPSKRASDTVTTASFEADEVVAAILASVDGSPDGLYAGDEQSWRRRRSVEMNRWERMSDIASTGSTFLNIAWPALVRSALPRGPGAPQATASVSNAIAADLRRALPSMLTRLVLRSAAKATITDAVGDEYGRWAGALAGLAGGVLERADTRSWQLLPGQLSVVRIRVPVNQLESQVTIGGEFDAMSVQLPSRKLNPGEIVVTSARIFRDQSSLGPF